MEGYRNIDNRASHEEMVTTAVKELLCNDDYSDIAIAGGDGSSFPAHRFILETFSPYIKTLGEQSVHHGKMMLVFAHISKTTIEHLLTYIYKGEVNVPKEDLDEFYEFAKSMKLEGFESKKFRAEEACREEQDVTRGRLAADKICANMFQLANDNSNRPPVSRQSTSPYLPHGMITTNVFEQTVLNNLNNFNNLSMGGNFFPLPSAINSPLKPPMMRSPKPASTPRRDNFPNHPFNGIRGSKSPEEILLANTSIDFSKTANDARISPINPSLHSLVSAASTLPPNIASHIQQMAQQHQQSFNRSRSRSPVGSVVPSKVEAEDEPVDVQAVEDEDRESSIHSRSDSANNSNNRSDQNSSSGRETASPKIDVEEPQKMDMSTNLGLANPFSWGQLAHPASDAIQNLENPEQTTDLIHHLISRAQSQPPYQGLYQTLAPTMALAAYNHPVNGLPSAANLQKMNEAVATILKQKSSPKRSGKGKKTSKRAGPKPRKSEGKDGVRFHCKNEGCNRQYASSGNLKRHEKYECNKQPIFFCKFDGCGLSFQHKHSLKIHVNTAHRMSIDKDNNLIPLSEDPALKKKGRKPSKLLQRIMAEELSKSPPNSSLVIDKGINYLPKEEQPRTQATTSLSLGVNAHDLTEAFMRMQQQQQQQQQHQQQQHQQQQQQQQQQQEEQPQDQPLNNGNSVM